MCPHSSCAALRRENRFAKEGEVGKLTLGVPTHGSSFLCIESIHEPFCCFFCGEYQNGHR